jgi:hypothetical protein
MITALAITLAAVAAAATFMLGAVIHRARRSGGFRLAFYGDAILHRRNCTRCTGGAQRLNDDGHWGPIPANARMDLQRDERGQYFGPPSALARNCPYCNGMGFHLDAESQVRLPPANVR